MGTPRPSASNRCRGGRRGSGTLLNIAVMMIMLALSAAVAVLARYALAVHQAQNAADLAALAGAQALGAGADGCQAAARVAARNEARVSTCRFDGGGVDFVITVGVVVDVPSVLGLASTVSRIAFAGPAR